MDLRAKRDEIVAGGVAVAAFAASAQHVYHVCVTAGNPALVAALHPAGIDGLIYIGIRAMQKGNKRAGGAAIAYGALYSLAFNSASYGGFKMPVWALAACMPLAMFFAFLIVHGGHGATVEITPEVREVVREVVKVERVYPEFLPIVAPSPVRPATPRPRTQRTDGPTGTSGRVAGWDVEKAIGLMDEGRTNEEIASVLGDVGPKPLQRTRRALAMIRRDAGADAEIGGVCGLSAAHVARVRSVA